MSSVLTVTKQLSNTGWTITASITPGGTLPTQIFTYENTGTTTLGPYAGVIGAIDLPRIQIWNSIAIPVYGNKYVRHSVATILVTPPTDPDLVITELAASVGSFSKEFQSMQSSTQTFTIV